MESDTPFQLLSPSFVEGDTIPDNYTCKGLNVSPPLSIRGIPEGTVSLALIMHDTDAPGGDYLHWAVWNLDPDLKSLGESEVPDNAFQGVNDFGQTKYGGPCPPSGIHHYLFDLYALDTELDLQEGANRDELEESIEDHTIAKTTLTGIFSAS